jgi:PhnB protein
MKVESYLFFDGRCEEAVEFYKKALGAEVQALVRYNEAPDGPPPGFAEKIMHASFRIGDTRVMAADDCTGKHPSFDGFSQCIVLSEEALAQGHFAGLSEGGEVVMPLQKTFYSPCFGMVTDKFGILWMVMVEDEAHRQKAQG